MQKKMSGSQPNDGHSKLKTGSRTKSQTKVLNPRELPEVSLPEFVDSEELTRSLNEAEEAQKNIEQEKAELENQKAKFNAD